MMRQGARDNTTAQFANATRSGQCASGLEPLNVLVSAQFFGDPPTCPRITLSIVQVPRLRRQQSVKGTCVAPASYHKGATGHLVRRVYLDKHLWTQLGVDDGEAMLKTCGVHVRRLESMRLFTPSLDLPFVTLAAWFLGNSDSAGGGGLPV
eukprot:CAMPEP_0194481404 /NCGR_PEP_ID=MMETSP0253-20130528/3844_1 /TAXON_ID=2966 /ORGANISM="Noctiluca scintillans" /LENGTH=150 /DNA_ID=CAMNT_0039320887 /DNA_START=310 /DNA_END=763 /DNA_ORIENTATION=-